MRKISHRRSKIAVKKNAFILVVAAAIVLLFFISRSNFLQNTGQKTPDTASLKSELFPSEGFKTKIVLGNTIPKLVESGAIDMEKFKELYGDALTEKRLKLLTEPDNEPLVLTPEGSTFLINVFWPLGIANKNPILEEAGKYEGIGNLASTGGWTLGKEDTMTYYNKLELVKLTDEQQAVLERVAKTTYRPCCDNPTAFPDCNHGAALLALLELGASQGMSEDELYELALRANTLWFPQQYLSTATLYNSQGKDYWDSAKEIAGYEYSSYSGWVNNVYKPLEEKGLLPKAEGGGSCSV